MLNRYIIRPCGTCKAFLACPRNCFIPQLPVGSVLRSQIASHSYGFLHVLLCPFSVSRPCFVGSTSPHARSTFFETLYQTQNKVIAFSNIVRPSLALLYIFTGSFHPFSLPSPNMLNSRPVPNRYETIWPHCFNRRIRDSITNSF